MLRWFAYTLFVLVVAKVYAQDHVFKSATSEALIAAYRDKAVSACRNDKTFQSATASPVLWAERSEIAIQIGRPDLGVSIWEVDHALWEAAYKKPYLVLRPTDSHTALTCTYDITADAANLSRNG